MDFVDLSEHLLVRAMSVAGADEGYLIGSHTTGEASIQSDVDFLLVLNRQADEFECFQVAQRFRNAVQGATIPRVGVRCRRISELQAFARYLLLQGYDTRFARRICESGAAPACLQEAAFSATTRNEYLCVLGEALWTDVRLRGGLGNAGAAAYEAAKACLTYLNLALVARSTFLPTNSARVAAWEVELGCVHGLRDALACKAGESREVSDTLLACTAQLRDEAFERIADFDAIAGYYDPAIFWLPAPLDHEFGPERVEAMIGICTYLYQIASGDMPAPPDARVLLHFDRTCVTAGDCLSATAINRFRLRNSLESRRDWGTEVDWIYSEPRGR